jgi:hypothetical protein
VYLITMVSLPLGCLPDLGVRVFVCVREAATEKNT